MSRGRPCRGACAPRRLRLGLLVLSLSSGGLVAVAAPSAETKDPTDGGDADYAAARRGEFLGAQYQRAVELEAEAMNLAANGRYDESDEALALAIRIQEQLVGSRHPQLLRPLLAKAENAAVWGDRLGMQGRPQVELAKELVERSKRILSAAPPTTQETMEEESVRLKELTKVVDQMLEALSPPKGLSSPLDATELSELPHPIRRVHQGQLLAGSLNRTVSWAYFGCPVYENWVHAHTDSPEKDAQVTVYGIQTVTTASLITHEARMELFASVVSPMRVAEPQGGNSSRLHCRWWQESECVKALTAKDFGLGGGKGVAVGRQRQGRDAPMWFHFMELPAEAGHIALLAARLSAAAGRQYTFMLQVHEDPLIPLHLGEGVQTWELDGFRASVHYFPWDRSSRLHSLETKDLSCPIPSDARLLVSWDSIPSTSADTLSRSQQCVESSGQTNRLAPGGCWADGASDSGRTLFVVVLNPCPEPTQYTMVAKWEGNGNSPPMRSVAGHPAEDTGESKAGAEYHTQSQHLREHFAQEHMQGLFVPSAKPEAWPGPAAHAVMKRLLYFFQASLVPIAFILALSLLYVVLISRLSKVQSGSFGPPSQRRRPRGGGVAATPFWKLPTLAELSGSRPANSTEPDHTYELNLRRGRVTVSAVPVNRGTAQRSGISQHPASTGEAAATSPSTGRGITFDTLRARRGSPSDTPQDATTSLEPTRPVVSDSVAANTSTGADITEADNSLPQIFFCPITQELMRDPVFAADGYTYERAAITKWLRKRPNSPMTNLPLARQDLVPNHMLRSAVQEALEAQQAATDC